MKLASLPLVLMMCGMIQAADLHIGSVPLGYTLNYYTFQADPETRQAAVVLRYTWPDTVVGGDTGPGLNSVPVRIPGLDYDAANHEVVYSAEGKRWVCAIVKPKRFLFWGWRAVSPTGECAVISRPVVHQDTGWDHHRREMIDTFLEVR